GRVPDGSLGPRRMVRRRKRRPYLGSRSNPAEKGDLRLSPSSVGWTINVQQERPGNPGIAPTPPRTCRRPAPPPATATGRASAGRPGGGGSASRPTESLGLADRRLESPAEEDRQGGVGPVLHHDCSAFLVPPTAGSPGREPGNGSTRDSHALGPSRSAGRSC